MGVKVRGLKHCQVHNQNHDCARIRWNFVPIEQVDRIKFTIAN